MGRKKTIPRLYRTTYVPSSLLTSIAGSPNHVNLTPRPWIFYSSIYVWWQIEKHSNLLLCAENNLDLQMNELNNNQTNNKILIIYWILPSYLRTFEGTFVLLKCLPWWMTRVYDSEMTMSAGSGLKSFDCPEFDRCSFDEEVHIAYGLKLKFHRCSVNFEVDHRLLGRRACVVLRTEMACVWGRRLRARQAQR